MPATEEPPRAGRMRLARSFVLPVPPDRAFDVVTDAERVAAVVPGVTLTGWDGTAFAASARLRVGPLVLAGRGAGRFRRRDRRAGHAVVEVARRDGVALGTVTITVRPDGPGGEHSTVAVRADLLAPRAGGLIGRSVVAEIGHRMFAQAGAALAAGLGEEPLAVAGSAGHGSSPVLRLPRLVLPAVTGAATVTAGITVAVCRRMLRPR